MRPRPNTPVLLAILCLVAATLSRERSFGEHAAAQGSVELVLNAGLDSWNPRLTISQRS